jgi:hypothetical protein
MCGRKGRGTPEAIGHDYRPAAPAHRTGRCGVDLMPRSAYHSAEIFCLKQSFRLHLAEDLAPAFATLERSDLISAQVKRAGPVVVRGCAANRALAIFWSPGERL